MSDTSFEEIHAQLVAEWLSKLDEAKTDKEAGEILIEFVLQRERIRAGVTVAGPDRVEVDQRTRERLGNPAELGPAFSRDEAVFRRLISDPSSAVVYLRTAVEQRSKAQSDRASKGRPSRKDHITEIIEEIVAVNPAISAKQVGKCLELDCYITLIGDEYHHITDASRLKVSNLASRVSDAKGRLPK